MNLVLWIVAGLLALAFVAAGVMKLTRSKATLATSGMPWTEDYSAGTIRGIGVLELLAAVGLVLPAVLNIAPILVPVAALGLVAIMIGAIYTHARRKEYPMTIGNLVLLGLAAFVAWGRFDGVPFTS
jgi:uncharacterized membrane protein YphA (DoxX/SURF4 family)